MNLAKEKEELRCLNDRFAAYIDKVKSLEEENKRLKKNARWVCFFIEYGWSPGHSKDELWLVFRIGLNSYSGNKAAAEWTKKKTDSFIETGFTL